MYMHKQGRFNCCVQPTSDRRLLEPSLGQWSHGKAKSLASGHTGKPCHWPVVTRESHIIGQWSQGEAISWSMVHVGKAKLMHPMTALGSSTI